MKNFIILACFILLAQSAGFVGAYFTFDAIPVWYAFLNKPFFSPPNWIFGPVWTILYTLMGIAAYLVYKKGLMLRQAQHKRKQAVKFALNIFYIQLGLNTLRSIIFFGLRSPIIAFGEIIILWVIIFLTMKTFVKLSKTAGYLLIPYLLWVTFAAFLNLAIVILNR